MRQSIVMNIWLLQNILLQEIDKLLAKDRDYAIVNIMDI